MRRGLFYFSPRDLSFCSVMSAIGIKQTLVCVATMSAVEVKRASTAPEGHVCFPEIGCAHIQPLSVWSFETSSLFSRALVLLRRQQVTNALAASYPRLRLIASTFFDNLVQLRRQSPEACFEFISQG
jgi:hypothetical protein